MGESGISLKKCSFMIPPPSSSNTCVSFLHEELLVDILCRLPLKQLIRLKCLSKSWYTLISDVCVPKITSIPVFGLIYCTCSDQPNPKRDGWSFACIPSSDNFCTVNKASLAGSCLGRTLPFRPSPDNFFDCCNGLLLFFDDTSRHYFVCNPATQQYNAIPNSHQNKIPLTGALIFDPDYKVVHISGVPHEMSIFSSATGQWSIHSLDMEVSTIRSIWSPRCIYLNGSLYRLSVTGYMFKFDVRQIGYRAIELPKVVKREFPIGSLGVSQGSIHYGWADEISKMMVWVLKVESVGSEEWVLKHTICLQFFDQHPLCSTLYDRSVLFDVLAFHPTSDKMFVGNFAGIFCYDPSTKELETIHTLSYGRAMFNCQSYVYPFSPNLTPLHKISQSIPKKISDELCRECRRRLIPFL